MSLRSWFLTFIILLLSKIVIAQGTNSSLTQKYLADKKKFEAFEGKHRGNVQTGNHKISYLKWGNNSNKVFIWLPGSLLSAYDFYPFAEELVKEGYCVLSVDHYGHGLTSIPGKDLDFWDFADDLSFLMNSLGMERAVIGGFSRGGYLATAFYEKYPEKVNALILEDGGTVSFRSLFDNMDSPDYRSFSQSIEPPLEIKKLLFDRYASEFDVYKNLYEIDGSEQQWQTFGFIRKEDNYWVLYYGLNEFMNMQDSLHYSQVLWQPELVSDYASSIARVDPLKVYSALKVPMLIIEAIGKPDAFDSTQGNKKLKDLNPNLVQYKLFDCDNHNIHYGCPELFIKEVKSFLRTL